MFSLIAKYATESDTGERFIVHEYQEFLEVRTKTGIDHIPGMKKLQLADGTAVTPIDEDTFKVVPTGVFLRRVR